MNYPKITPEAVEANIVEEHYFTARQGAEGASGGGGQYHVSLGLLTFCVLVLRNGFTVTGESACVIPETFDAEIGRREARENAVNKVWPLMGYKLKCDIAEQAKKLYTLDDIHGYEMNHTYGGLWVKFKDGKMVEVQDDHAAVADSLEDMLYKACVKANTSSN